MTTPTVRRRKLPRNDWEGDDFTPGAGGKYVTCMDTAAGRMVAFATNGRITHDGKTYRAAIKPPDPNGINYDQIVQAVHDVAHLPVIHQTVWTPGPTTAWLKAAKGLMVTGRYDTIPRMYRFQAFGGFLHEMWVSHCSQDGTKMRLYDPLDPRTDLYGRTVPLSILWPFLKSSGYHGAYVPLQHL